MDENFVSNLAKNAAHSSQKCNAILRRLFAILRKIRNRAFIRPLQLVF